MLVNSIKNPFDNSASVIEMEAGLKISEIISNVYADRFHHNSIYVFLDGNLVPRKYWSKVTPKESANLCLKMVPQGGGGGGKNPLRTVLTIALTVGVIALTGGAAAGLLGATFASGTLGASLLAGGAMIAGQLLINAIAPIRPPAFDQGSGGLKNKSPTFGIETARNTARPFTPFPVILGTSRQVPPLAAKTYVETLGEQQYLRMLVVWAYGPAKIENIRIGETPITSFDDVDIETREGRGSDTPITIYPGIVNQESFSIKLTQADSWQTRTTSDDADEISVDLLLPKGLFRSGGNGIEKRTLGFQIEYRQVGIGSFVQPTFTRKTVPNSWVTMSQIVLTHARSSTIRHGFRWSVSRGKYEVRIRKTSMDFDDTEIFEDLFWSTLTTFTNESPINFSKNLAISAISIRATDQLNGVVDELNADISSYVKDFSDVEVISSNPAVLYRAVLQHPANAFPATDDEIDLDNLSDWADYCDAQGFEFNMIRDYQSSIWDLLSDIASSGRASPENINGKHGVVVDNEKPFISQHFTPHNSWGFSLEKIFPEELHGLKVRFQNRNEGFRQDEMIVYADGFDSSNALLFESIDAIGITDPDHIWKYGRFYIAHSILRPERWIINTDVEYLVASRGSRVKVNNDAMLVGLGSGRIVSVYENEIGDVVGIRSSDTFEMENDTEYGVVIRNSSDVAISRKLKLNQGTTNELLFDSAILAINAPLDGDIFSFGLFGLETVDGIIMSVEPQSDLSARLIILPYAPELQNSDIGEIPAFNTGLTPIVNIPDAKIDSIRSDESALRLGSGNTLIPGINVSLENINLSNVSIEAQIRVSGSENFVDADIVANQGNSILIGDVVEGVSYDVRARWNNFTNPIPGMWAYQYNHRVIGQTNPPQGLQNFTISVFGGSALLRWSRPPELDVRFGGEVRFRHSPSVDESSAVWQSSTSIGSTANGDALLAQLPLKPGTYLARVYDKSGRPSDDVAKISTKQATVLTFANVDSITEDPDFLGTKDATVTVSSGSLILTTTATIDDVSDFDSIASFDFLGEVAAFGEYQFDSGFDFLSVVKIRLTSYVDATSVNTLDQIDLRNSNIDTWEDFDGTIASAADCRVFVRHTDDDPAGSPVWSEWNALDSGEFEARGFEFKAVLTTNDSAYTIRVDELRITADEL